jgi:GntR family transcriptional repressor for pyruvate dehydrogenase complex
VLTKGITLGNNTIDPMEKQVDNTFTVIKRKRVSEVVIEQIKELIYRGDLVIGDKLPSERDLAERLGVSRVPVREALFSLEQAGLVDIRRGVGGGVFIAEPGTKPYGEFFALMLQLGKASVRDLTEARLCVEPHVAMLAAQRASHADLEELEQTIKDYKAAVASRADRQFADMSFHISLARASKNIVMSMTIRGLIALLYKTVRDLDLADEDRVEVVRGHEAILRAVKQGDAESAAERMAAHVKAIAKLWS